MSVSIRPLLVPGIAFATAGVMALGPTMVAPPAITLAQPVTQIPVVHIEDIQLAGFGLDLYNALNGWVEFGVQVLQDFFFWNPAIAAQIGTLYSTLQPIITAVVTFIDTLSQGPTDIIGTLTSLVGNLLPAFGIGLPSLAAVATGKSSAPLAAARKAAGPRAAAVVAEMSAPAEAADVAAEVVAEVVAEVPAPARASRGELGRAARTAAVGARQERRAVASEVSEAAQQAAADGTAAPSSPTRAGRGATARAAG